MRIIVTLVLFLAGLPVLRAQTCPNRCLDFDGASDFVQSAAAPVTGNADFTAEARFYCTSPTTSTAFRRLFAFGGASTRIEVGEIGGKLAYQRLSSAGTFGPSQVPTTTGIPLRANGWHHVAVRRSGGAGPDAAMTAPLVITR